MIIPPTESDAYHVYHDWEERELATSLGICLVKATDDEIGDLGTPLYEVIDVEALETLLAPRDGGRDTAKQVRFTIDGHTVTVSSHTELAHIRVHPNETTPEEPHMLVTE